MFHTKPPISNISIIVRVMIISLSVVFFSCQCGYIRILNFQLRFFNTSCASVYGQSASNLKQCLTLQLKRNKSFAPLKNSFFTMFRFRIVSFLWIRWLNWTHKRNRRSLGTDFCFRYCKTALSSSPGYTATWLVYVCTFGELSADKVRLRLQAPPRSENFVWPSVCHHFWLSSPFFRGMATSVFWELTCDGLASHPLPNPWTVAMNWENTSIVIMQDVI